MRPLLKIGLAGMAGLLLCFMLGCSGDKTGQPQTGGAGIALFTVVWPPSDGSGLGNTQSIAVELHKGTLSIDRQVTNRPETGTESQVSFADVAPGDYTYSAAAYAETNGMGTTLATATGAVTVQRDQTTRVTLALRSTIDHLALSPAAPTIDVGQSVGFSVTAFTADNQTVFIDPATLTWTSDSTAVASVDNTGRVIGLSAGAARITVREPVSGKEASTTVTVTRPVTEEALTKAYTLLEGVTTDPTTTPSSARGALTLADAGFVAVLEQEPQNARAKFGLAVTRTYLAHYDAATVMPLRLKQVITDQLDIPGVPAWPARSRLMRSLTGDTQARISAETLPRLNTVLDLYEDVMQAAQGGADLRLRLAIAGQTRTVIFMKNDVELLAAYAHLMASLCNIGIAFNLDLPNGSAVRPDAADFNHNGLLEASEYLIPAPFLERRDAQAVTNALAALKLAASHAQRGCSREGHTAGANALVNVMDAQVKEKLQTLNNNAAMLVLACSTAVTTSTIFPDNISRTIDLSRLAQLSSLRPIFPSFPAQQLSERAIWPDPTFGGTFTPGLPANFLPVYYQDITTAF